MATCDLWVDFQQGDADGLTPTLTNFARPGVELRSGSFVLVGSDDSELAVAEIVKVNDDGVVLTRVLQGPAEDRLALLDGSHQSTP